MNLPSVKITGIQEVQAMLTKAPKNIVLLGFARALDAGITVVATEVLARVPISHVMRWNPETFGEIADFAGGGTLAQALVTEVVVDANSRGGMAAVGFGKMGHVANWVEYGHRMVTHRPGKKEVGQVRAHPFMRPAAAVAADRAIDAFAKSLEGTLREGVLLR